MNKTAYRILEQKALEKSAASWADIQTAASEYLNNPDNWKNMAIGTGAGLGTYLLSGLLPGAKKKRGARALLSFLAAVGATAAGDHIRGGAQSLWDKTPWSAAGQQRAATRQRQEDERQRAAEMAAAEAEGNAAYGPTWEDQLKALRASQEQENAQQTKQTMDRLEAHFQSEQQKLVEQKRTERRKALEAAEEKRLDDASSAQTRYDEFKAKQEAELRAHEESMRKAEEEAARKAAWEAQQREYEQQEADRIAEAAWEAQQREYEQQEADRIAKADLEAQQREYEQNEARLRLGERASKTIINPARQAMNKHYDLTVPGFVANTADAVVDNIRNLYRNGEKTTAKVQDWFNNLTIAPQQPKPTTGQDISAKNKEDNRQAADDRALLNPR